MRGRQAVLGGLLTALALAAPVCAQDYAADLESRLKGQGYEIDTIERTLLGRVRIVARGPDGAREVIVNPRTGEILRDMSTASDDSDSSVSSTGNKGQGSGGQGGDDSSDDDDGDDNSGHGGGNGNGSNNGGGNSGGGSGGGSSGGGGSGGGGSGGGGSGGEGNED